MEKKKCSGKIGNQSLRESSIETLHQKLSCILVSLDKIPRNHCGLFHDILSQVTFSSSLVDIWTPGSRMYTVTFVSN